jgi:hypothetical protein
LLASAASPGWFTARAAVAMGESRLVARIRNVLQLADHSARLSRKGLGLVAVAALVAVVLAVKVGSQQTDAPSTQPTEPGRAQRGSAADKARSTAGEEPTTAPKDFLRPVSPQDHFEAGELWAMPLPDGRLRISPLRQWSQTGLELREGQRLEIRAEGYVQGCQRPVDDWAYGPWSPAGGPAKDDPGSRVCALIGRIVGETETREFIVGERLRGEVPFEGQLALGVSDVRHFDNSGEFVVAIEVDGKPVDFTRHLAGAVSAANLVATMRPMNEAEVRWLDGARQIGSRREADRPMLATKQWFSPPLELRVRARTDSANIRLYYGYFGIGVLMFNWEVRPDNLRVHDPATGAARSVRGAGGVQKGEFHDIVWSIGSRQMQVLVDGDERYRRVGYYRNVVTPVGIGPAWGSRVDVESVVVAPLEPPAIDQSHSRSEMDDEVAELFQRPDEGKAQPHAPGTETPNPRGRQTPATDVASPDAVEFYLHEESHVEQNRVQPSPNEPDHTIATNTRVSFKGRVTNVSTGEPIKAFAVVPGNEWTIGHTPIWDDSIGQRFADGQYEIQPDNVGSQRVAIRIQADGYAPAASPLFDPDAGPQVFNVALEPTQHITLTVRRPDGSPVAQADVYVLDEDSLHLREGQVDCSQPPTQTDAGGQVALPGTSNAAAVFIVHDDGCAKVDQDRLATVKNITLQPWARVEGRSGVTGTDNEDREIRLLRIENGVGQPLSYQITDIHSVVVDTDGRFAIERVWPGPGVIGIKGYYSEPIDLVAGQTTQVILGGSGRHITGRLVMPENVDLNECRLFLAGKSDLAPPDAPDRPERWAQMDSREREAWLAQWRRSTQGRAYQAAAREHYIRSLQRRGSSGTVNADGTFDIRNVPPGNYLFRATLCTVADREARIPSQVVATVARELTVDQGDSILDLGTIVPTPVATAAFEFDIKTLDGKPLRLTDHRGKFVLLIFWSTRCGPCIGETRYLKGVYDAFGDDERFVMIGLSLDDEPLAPIEYAAKADLKWIQGFLGNWVQATLPRHYGVRGIPSIFLIGPDGKFTAKNLRGDRIRAAIAEALAADKHG